MTIPAPHLARQSGSNRCTRDLRAKFETILPRIETHARIYFRAIKCPHKKADCVAEAIALAWKWFVRLAEKGKDATQYPSVLATYAARATRAGRRVCGQERAKDVMSAVCQRRRNFAVGKLPDCSTLGENPLAEALIDNTQTPPPEAAAFRIDFPAWLYRQSNRDRALICDMAMGERTKCLAERYEVSESRISQKRREYSEGWETFCAA